MNDSRLPHIEAEDDKIDVLQYLHIINRNKSGIAGLTFAVIAVTILVVFSLSPVFQASATLLIEAEEANVVSIEEVYRIDSSQREYYQTQFEILNSRKLAERVIRELDLRNHPEFDVDNPDNRSITSKILGYVAFWRSPKAASEDLKMQLVVSRFRNQLSILPVPNTQLVQLTFESEDARLAPLVVNTLGNAYVDSHLEARLELTQKASNWLTERLGGMRMELEAGERRLREFQESENLVDVSGVQTLTANELDELTRRLVQARNAASVAKSQVDAVGVSDEGYSAHWETLPGVLRDSLAQTLKADEAEALNVFNEVKRRYGPKHPTYISAASNLSSSEQAFRARVKLIVDGFDEQYQQALADQREVERSLDAAKGEIQSINRKTYELTQLQREVETSRQLYDMFFQRFQETNQTDFAAANARFVDVATQPFTPVKPRKFLIVALAGVLSLMVGVMLALLRVTLNNTIREAEDVEQKLGKAVLGVVPLLTDKSQNDNVARSFSLSSDSHTFQESIRSVRTSVLLSGFENAGKLFLVTSALPGEGKTTISSNLAQAFGQMGSVLLIDADMRRPSLARAYGLSKGVGLSELIAQSSTIDECVTKTDEGIDVIPAGTVPPNPLELLSSNSFERLLNELVARYDKIIIDSAPAQAVSDSLVLSQLVDGLVFVVKSDKTHVREVKNALERLDSVKAPLLGIVLNQFDAKAAMGTKGYGYYGYGYASNSYT